LFRLFANLPSWFGSWFASACLSDFSPILLGLFFYPKEPSLLVENDYHLHLAFDYLPLDNNYIKILA
jgi:hypothetical protein